MRTARAGAAVLSVALAISACGSGAPKTSTEKSGSTTSGAATTPAAAGVSTLVAAAVRSSQAPGEKVGLTVDIETPQLGTIGITGHGVYDNSARSGSLRLAVSIPSNSSLA